MADVEERKRALEEKRKKLEELRKRNAEKKDAAEHAPAHVATPTKAAEPAVAREKAAAAAKKQDSEVDSLVESLISRKASIEPKEPKATPVKTPSKGQTQAQKKAGLVSISTFGEFNVFPKPTESYSKEVQTVDFGPSSNEEEENDPAVPPSVGSPKKPVHSSMEEAHAKPEVVVTEEPKHVDLTQQQKKEITESESFQEFFAKTSLLVERALGATDGYDFMVDYTVDQESHEMKKQSESIWLKTKFFDERWTKYRSATDICFSPQYPELVMASYNSRDGEQLRLDQTAGDPDGVVLVWNMNLSERTEFQFHCQSAVMTAQFSKFSPNVVIGGTYSGQIVMWDTRAKSAPVQRTPQSSTGHTHPVYSMAVVGTENAHNLATVSTDGRFCVWSLGMLTQPQETIALKQLKQNKDVPATILAFPSEEVNTFFVGSEEGSIYQANRHGSKEGVHTQFDGHYGPIMGMDFFNCEAQGATDYYDLFLSCGTDWTVKLWSHRSQQCLYSFEEADDYIYDVRWSPVHPAVFACCDGSGSIQVWNLNEDTEVPLVRTNVSAKALNKLKWGRDGKTIAVGDSAGYVYLYHVSPEIYQPKSDDMKRFDQRVNEMRQT